MNIIDEQDEFIVINKPAGIGFHDDENQQGFFNQVKQFLALEKLYPVHRLDKMTSGLLIVAKTKDAAVQFQRLFEERNIEKYYLAISDKKPIKKQGLIKGDMEKSRRGMWKILRTQLNPAITQFFSFSLQQGKRLFVVKPHTGKTHQIRVALNSLGSPILGDPTYHALSKSDRGYLHAFVLRFELNGTKYQYTCPPLEGEAFINNHAREVIDTHSRPWELTWPK
jgi:tRNA pseudouridine32 synthase/23S rRNA pseudouridine746 synthase